MGQYYYCVNIDKKEYIHPHKFGDGLKLTEFGLSGMGTMAGLAILLADGNGRGGGDIQEDPVSEIVGRWAGDRIVIAGDYADEGRFVTAMDVKKPLEAKKICLHDLASDHFKDISYDVLFALMADSYFREGYGPRTRPSDPLIKDFYLIHEQLANNSQNMALLIGIIKSPEGIAILEKFLKKI
jgi:hypothetical protein